MSADGEKGFNFKDLPVKTKLKIQTKNSSYELVLLENKKALIVGGNLPNQGFRFSKPTIISLIGSAKNNSYLPIEDWIFCGMRLEFTIDKTNELILTSEIIKFEINP